MASQASEFFLPPSFIFRNSCASDSSFFSASLFLLHSQTFDHSQSFFFRALLLLLLLFLLLHLENYTSSLFLHHPTHHIFLEYKGKKILPRHDKFHFSLFFFISLPSSNICQKTCFFAAAAFQRILFVIASTQTSFLFPLPPPPPRLLSNTPTNSFRGGGQPTPTHTQERKRPAGGPFQKKKKKKEENFSWEIRMCAQAFLSPPPSDPPLQSLLQKKKCAEKPLLKRRVKCHLLWGGRGGQNIQEKGAFLGGGKGGLSSFLASFPCWCRLGFGVCTHVNQLAENHFLPHSSLLLLPNGGECRKEEGEKKSSQLSEWKGGARRGRILFQNFFLLLLLLLPLPTPPLEEKACRIFPFMDSGAERFFPPFLESQTKSDSSLFFPGKKAVFLFGVREAGRKEGKNI